MRREIPKHNNPSTKTNKKPGGACLTKSHCPHHDIPCAPAGPCRACRCGQTTVLPLDHAVEERGECRHALCRCGAVDADALQRCYGAGCALRVALHDLGDAATQLAQQSRGVRRPACDRSPLRRCAPRVERLPAPGLAHVVQPLGQQRLEHGQPSCMGQACASI